MIGETLAMGILLGAAVAVAMLRYRATGRLLDPAVVFPLVYAYATAGPYLYAAWADVYHPGLKRDHLAAVLLSCATALVAFAGGCLMGDALARRLDCGMTAEARDRRIDAWAAWLGLILCIAGLATFALSALMMASAAGSEGKDFYDAHRHTLLYAVFKRSGAAVIVAFAIYMAGSAQSGARVRGTLLAVLFTVFCTLAWERDYVLLWGIWLGAQWRLLRRSMKAACIAAVALLMAASAAARGMGSGTSELLSRLRAGDGSLGDEIFRQATTFSSNVHVYTNVVHLIPAQQPYRYGETFLISLASFIPLEFDYKHLSPQIWFQGAYDRQSLSGWGFGMDAEGYMNFGWAGPPLVFLVWGCVLGLLHARGRLRRCGMTPTFYLYALVVSLFAIRADSRFLLKSLIVGWLFFAVTWGAARILDVLSQRRHPPATKRFDWGSRRRPAGGTGIADGARSATREAGVAHDASAAEGDAGASLPRGGVLL